MSRKSVRVLAEATEALERGSSVRQCLAAWPELRRELEPRLRAAQRLRAAPRPVPRPEFRRAARERLLAVARRTPARPVRRRIGAVAIRRLAYSVRPLAAGLMLALLAVGVAGAPASAEPGQPLYPAKLAVERVELAVAPGDADRAMLHLSFARRRLDELAVAARSGDGELAATLGRQYYEHVDAALAIGERSRAPIEPVLRQQLASNTPAVQQAIHSSPPVAATALQRTLDLVARAPATAVPQAAQSAGPAAPPVAAATASATPVAEEPPALDASLDEGQPDRTANGKSVGREMASTKRGQAGAPQSVSVRAEPNENPPGLDDVRPPAAAPSQRAEEPKDSPGSERAVAIDRPEPSASAAERPGRAAAAPPPQHASRQADKAASPAKPAGQEQAPGQDKRADEPKATGQAMPAAQPERSSAPSLSDRGSERQGSPAKRR